MNRKLNVSDRARIEWCVSAMREIATELRGNRLLGDMYPLALQAIDGLKRVLEEPDAGTRVDSEFLEYIRGGTGEDLSSFYKA